MGEKKVELFPEIKPLIHVLKRYLQINKLNSTFNGKIIEIINIVLLIGGLSSHSLFLMIIAFIKYPKMQSCNNLGRALLEFLDFFGRFFNFNQFLIDVSNNFKYIILTKS